jgi:hypothetical protein
LKRIIACQRDENGKLVSDGMLAIHKKQQGAEGEDQGAEGDAFHAILDRTERSCPNDMLELNVPIRAFIAGDLAFCTTGLGKEGVDKSHCIWCKLKNSEWQTCGHEPGIKWTLQELERVAAFLNAARTSENGVKGHPLLDCMELERHIFPVLHVTLGLVNWLLKDTIDCADLVVERTPEVLKDAGRTRQKREASLKQANNMWQIGELTMVRLLLTHFWHRLF